jgi:hypothetical protein
MSQDAFSVKDLFWELYPNDTPEDSTERKNLETIYALSFILISPTSPKNRCMEAKPYTRTYSMSKI